MPLALAQEPLYVEQARNDWISPSFVVNYHQSKCANQAKAAIDIMAVNATLAAKMGPWTVINDEVASPNGDSRAYVSFARYYWADCCEDQEERKGKLAGMKSDNRRRKRTFGDLKRRHMK